MFDHQDRPVISACFFASIALFCLFIHWDMAAFWACIGAFVWPIGALIGEAGPTDFDQHEVSK